jgi:hypothetical protein
VLISTKPVCQEQIYESGYESLAGEEIYGKLGATAISIEVGANLQKSDLRSTDLSGVYLSEANLSDVNLQYADLSDIDLSEANLSNANLQYADLNRSILFQANLENADLDYANLTDADLEQANLSNAQTRMTIFCNTIMPDGTIRDDGWYGR